MMISLQEVALGCQPFLNKNMCSYSHDLQNKVRIFVLRYQDVILLKTCIPKDEQNTDACHFHRYANGLLCCCDSLSLWIILKIVLEDTNTFFVLFLTFLMMLYILWWWSCRNDLFRWILLFFKKQYLMWYKVPKLCHLLMDFLINMNESVRHIHEVCRTQDLGS